MSALTIPGIDNLPQLNLAQEPVIGTLLRPIEAGMTSLGLTTPSLRLLGVGAASGAVLYYFKPRQFFHSNGQPRPWSMWQGGDSNFSGLDPVPVPWWMAAVLAGTGAAIFL